MADKKNPEIEATVARTMDKVNQEVEKHKGEEFNLDELEDVSGGWRIYSTDPVKPTLEDQPLNPSNQT